MDRATPTLAALCLAAAIGLTARPALSQPSPRMDAADRSERLVRAARERARREISTGEPVRNFQARANETCQPNLLLCGQTVESALAPTDCMNPSGFADFWFFPSYTPQAVGVAVSSSDFDVLTGLLDPHNGRRDVAVAKAGGVASFGDFLTESGNYDIVVTSQATSVSKAGSYRVSLACGADRCIPDNATLCLGRKRFRVQVAWHNQFNDTYGFAGPIARTDSGGFFAFTDLSNIELLVKVLDFGGGTVKVFLGELTNLEFAVAVTDMTDPLGHTKTYTNTPGDCGGIDQDFFAASRQSLRSNPAAASGRCRPDKGTVCLLKRRFALTMTWHNQFNGTSGSGGAVPLSDLTGAFYFNDRSDLELVAKMIDFGDRIAVFYGALSDLEYDLDVTDTLTGQAKTYHNPPGHYCGGLDNTAFR
jgi:hypothetical protein